MIQKPKHFAPKHAESFKDFGVVETYHYRPPYPPETFDILTGLINTEIERYRQVTASDITARAAHIFRETNCSTLYYLSKK